VDGTGFKPVIPALCGERLQPRCCNPTATALQSIAKLTPRSTGVALNIVHVYMFPDDPVAANDLWWHLRKSSALITNEKGRWRYALSGFQTVQGRGDWTPVRDA